MGWLEGQVALVTGGGSGIGRGVVETFAEEGASVGVLDINEAKIKSLFDLDNAKIAPILGDATILEDNVRAVSATLSKFGKLDILVCCPGIFDFFTNLVDIPDQKVSPVFDEIFNTDVKSYLLSTKAAIPELLKSEGSIIYTVSSAGFYPANGGPIYTAAKFAVRGLVMEMAYELSPKIRVNGIAPGGTVTDLRGPRALGLQDYSLSAVEGVEELIRKTGPLQIVPTPKDHAWSYVLLASKQHSRAVTGTIIHSDSGVGLRGLTKTSGLS